MTEVVCGCAPAFDLVGTTEFAAICGVTKQAVSTWHKKNLSFPPPVDRRPLGPLWFRWQARLWCAERNAKPQRPGLQEKAGIRYSTEEERLEATRKMRQKAQQNFKERHPEKYRQKVIRNSKNKKPEQRKKEKDRHNRKSIEELRDHYVAMSLLQTTDLKKNDVPPELIELKRAAMLLKRLMKAASKEAQGDV